MKDLSRLILVPLLLGLAACASFDREETKSIDGEPVEVATLVAKNGSKDRFTSVSPTNASVDVKAEIRKNIKVKFNKKKYLCRESRETEWRISKQVELQLELKEMIRSLSDGEKPRRLSEAQEYVLSKVQLCDPFLYDLRIISKLIDGYDLERVEVL